MVQRLEPDPDLDDLVRRLNASARDTATSKAPASADEAAPAAIAGSPAARWPLPEADPEVAAWLQELLTLARKADASDLLLVAGRAPAMRVTGDLSALPGPELSPAAAAGLCACLVPGERRATVESHGHLDFSADSSAGRIRVNIHRERGRWAAAVRLFQETPPDLGALGLPAQVAALGDLPSGLLLVTGATGSGKSTTLAALARRILQQRRVHLITLEDPVEFEHPHGEGIVEHVEVGRDVESYAGALRSVLRQDPDVILVGEMRDAESIGLAISAAETGHLVLSTLHTADCAQTIHRIVDGHPSEQRDAVRAQLSASLAGIVSQFLLPRANGRGRAVAAEVLTATHAVRNLVRQGRIEQVRAQIALERDAGMLPLDDCLARLVRDGIVAAQSAIERAHDPEDLRRRIG